MNNAIVVGVIVLILVVFLLAYVVWQETRAQRYWRQLVEAGDLDAIRQILDTELGRWRSGRLPRAVPAQVWAGVQRAEVTDVSPRAVWLSTSAEGQYGTVDGQRREVSTPLDEGMKIFAKLAELSLYDLPHLRFEKVHIDVYSTFRGRDGSATQRCILSGTMDRGTAAEIDWDSDPPEAIVHRCGARFRRSERGAVLSIEPESTPAAPRTRRGRTANAKRRAAG